MDKLRNALESIRDAIEAHLQATCSRAEAWVALTNLANGDGSMADGASEKIVMSVYNIALQPSLKSDLPTRATAGASEEIVRLALSVDLMFMANFSGNSYGDGLSRLSDVMAFLHAAPVFDGSVLHASNLDATEINAILTLHGGGYRPVVFYRLDGIVV